MIPSKYVFQKRKTIENEILKSNGQINQINRALVKRLAWGKSVVSSKGTYYIFKNVLK